MNQKFDLIIAGTSFHWVQQEEGYKKAASLLKPAGYLALFWNLLPGLANDFFKKVQKAYSKHAPQIIGDYKKRAEYRIAIKKRTQQIKDTKLFKNLEVIEYPWEAEYSANEYITLLNTYSDHINLEEKSKNGLFTDIRKLINKLGGKIKRPYLSMLYISNKK